MDGQRRFWRGARGCLAVALGGLGWCGVSGAASGEDVATLARQLASPVSFARTAAAGKLGELGPAAAEAAPALLEALRCEQMEEFFDNPQIAASRRGFADALVKIGEPAIPTLEGGLKHENALVRVWSAYALDRLDRPRFKARVLSTLLEAIPNEVEAAGDAASLLESFGADAAAAIPDLMPQLAHRDFSVRCHLAYALAALAKEPAQQERLVAALEDSPPLVRVGAAFVILKAKQGATDAAMQALKQSLGSDSRDVRRQAAWACGQLGPAAQPLAKPLVAALPQLDPNMVDYFQMGGGLGRLVVDPALILVAMGPESKPTLVAALDESDPKTRLLAAIALVRLDPSQAERVAPVFAEARTKADQGMQFLLMMAAPPAPPPRNGPRDLDQLVQEALSSGGGFGPPSPAVGMLAQRGAEVVEPLLKVLKKGDGLAAQQAYGVFAAIGASAIPKLTEAAQSDDDQLRVFAVSALARMGPPAIPALTVALHDELYPVRRLARSALARLNTPEAQAALSQQKRVP